VYDRRQRDIVDAHDLEAVVGVPVVAPTAVTDGVAEGVLAGHAPAPVSHANAVAARRNSGTPRET